jgi:hypothetical protein
MRQALHIFKKDFRCFRYEICLMLAVTAVFVVLQVRKSFGTPYGPLNSWEAEMLMVIIAAVLIGRLILAEALPGDRQFWITRPYRWSSLLGAKLLFIAVFVNLPILLAHLFILILDGFPLVSSLPGLVWSQVLLFAVVLAPSAALAALCRNLASFILYAVVLAAIAFLLEARLWEVAWVMDGLAVVVVIAISAWVLCLQYKRRRTQLSRSFAIAGIVLGAGAMIAMPWSLAFAVQSRLSKLPSLGAGVQVAFGPSPAISDWPTGKQPEGAVYVPITLQGIPEGTEVRPDALMVSIEDSGGSSTTVNPFSCAPVTRHSLAAGLVLRAVCRADPEFVKNHGDVLVTLRGSIYLTLFGNSKSTTIPLSDEPVNASDGLQCYTDTVHAEWDVFCRSPFRWPGRLVYAKLGRTDANSFEQTISYSPFPAELNLNPIETRWASSYASGPPPNVPDVTIVVKEPLAHLRRDFEARGIRLSAFMLAPMRVGVPPTELPIH